MSEELGKMAKPTAEELKKGRKLYFIPLVYGGSESPAEYREKLDKYWSQVENQVRDLESKLAQINKIFHELVPVGGEAGIELIKDLNEGSHQITATKIAAGAHLEAIEDGELLTEFMDWNRCLAIGLQNQKVFTTVYESYVEAGKQRNEHIARHLDETLQADETGVLFMREGHQVQFPPDIQIFYVAPPALDEINRWLRDREAKAQGGQ